MSKILDPIPRCTQAWSTWCKWSIKKQLQATSRYSSALSRCSFFYRDDASDYWSLSNRVPHRFNRKVDGKLPRAYSWTHVPSLSMSLGRGDLIYYSGTSKLFKKVESGSSQNTSTTGPGATEQPGPPEDDENKKVSLFKRFKQMYRDYWYVLVPVHVITSIGWLGCFYYMAKSGVDIVALLESLGVSEKILNSLRDSKAGYIAITYALYKIATPLRYMVTIGGTTVSIQYLRKKGYIKPMPSKEKLKEMYQEKKETLIERRQNITDGLKQKTDKWKENTGKFMKDRERDGK